MSLEPDLRRIEQQVQAAALPEEAGDTGTQGVSQPAISSRERLFHLAGVAPRAAIVESWLELEAATIELARKRGIALNRPVSPLMIVRSLRDQGVIRRRHLRHL